MKMLLSAPHLCQCLIFRLLLSFGCSYFDGGLRRIDWRNFQYCSCLILIAVAVCPGIGVFRFRVTDQSKHFDNSIPSSLALKLLFDSDRCFPPRLAFVGCADSVLKLDDVFRWHSLKSDTLHALFSMLASIAGVSNHVLSRELSKQPKA